MTACPFDAELQDILERVLKLDLNCTPLHDIAVGLANYGCFTWNDLQLMDDNDINGLFKNDGNRRVPLLGNSTKKLRNLLEFTDLNRDLGISDPYLASTYTAENFLEYCQCYNTDLLVPRPPTSINNENVSTRTQ